MSLYKFNHDTVQWEIYGTGHVSSDGRTVNPDTDPTTGQPFGLRDFSWHLPVPPPPPTSPVSPGGNSNPCDSGCQCSRTGNTVDMSNGMKIERVTDIQFGGARGSLELTRIYTSDLTIGRGATPFGLGWTHNYAIRLSGSFQAGGAGRLVMPEELTGRLFSYAGTDASDGALLFTSNQTVGQLGDVVRKLTDGTFQYRRKDGTLMRFDASGNLTAIVDRNGNTTSLSYVAGNLTTITDAVGRSISLGYDSLNRIVSATDPIGRVWNYSYQGAGVATVTDPLNNTMRYVYQIVNGSGLLQQVFDYRGNRAKLIIYDNNGRVIREQYADGGADTFSYTLSGTVVTSTTRTDPEGRVTSMRFDASGYVLGSTDGLGQATTVQRSIGPSLPLSVTGPCGCTETTNTFDSVGNLLTSTDRLGNTETYQYEPVFNNLTRYTDKLGKVTSYMHDSNGNLTSVTRAVGTLNLTTQFGYDSFGELTGITDPLGHTTQVQHDSNGNATAVIDPLSDQTSFQYDGIGRSTSVADPLGRTTTMVYNALYLTDLTDAAGAKTHFDFDGNGNRIGITDALNNHWSLVYDQKNNLVSVTDPLGNQTTKAYNLDDDSITITTVGRATHYQYDQNGRINGITDPLGAIARGVYDSVGDVVAFSDQRGNTTTFSYDQLYRPIGSVDATGNSSSVSYDSMDNIVSALDRLGRQVKTTYDDIYRPVTTTYADASVTNMYDAASRLIEVDDSEGANIQWSYDAADRMLSETSAAGSVSYQYNAAGQRTSMAPANRGMVTYGYDTAGRPQTIARGSELFTYGYDALSRRSSLARPNGVTTAYQYDSASRLARLTHTGHAGQAIEDWGLGYNKDSEIASITSLQNPSLLPQSATASSADPANRIAQAGASNFTFDAVGETTSKTNGSGTATYKWDARGRLVQATTPGTQPVQYSYDAIGRLSSRTAAGVTTSFLYDGLDVVLDTGSGSSVDYLNGPHLDEKLSQNSGSGPQYFLSDHLGSTAFITDLNGTIVQSNLYTPFGAVSGAQLSRYGFTGREADSQTGLIYYRARWYDPQIGRFGSEDPLAYEGGSNLYEYTGDDFVNFGDPLGLLPKRWKNKPGPRKPKPCDDWQRAECAEKCANRGGMESCFVSRKWRFSNLQDGWVLVPAGVNCTCRRDEDDSGCDNQNKTPKVRAMPRRPGWNGPTNEELKLQQESADLQYDAWKAIGKGGVVLTVVLTGGALLPVAGAAGGGAAGGGVAEGAANAGTAARAFKTLLDIGKAAFGHP